MCCHKYGGPCNSSFQVSCLSKIEFLGGEPCLKVCSLVGIVPAHESETQTEPRKREKLKEKYNK
jgi:hypothetical protein